MNSENDSKHGPIFIVYFNFVIFVYWWWYAVAQLVEALRYKPEGRGFDLDASLGFIIDIILTAALWP